MKNKSKWNGSPRGMKSNGINSPLKNKEYEKTI